MQLPRAYRYFFGHSINWSEGPGVNSLVEIPSFNGVKSMTGHLVKLCAVVALQCGKESDIKGLE